MLPGYSLTSMMPLTPTLSTARISWITFLLETGMRARRRRRQPDDGAERGAFPRPVATDEGDDLPLFDREGDVEEDVAASVERVDGIEF